MPNLLLSNQNPKMKTSLSAVSGASSRHRPQVLTSKSSDFDAYILSASQGIPGVESTHLLFQVLSLEVCSPRSAALDHAHL